MRSMPLTVPFYAPYFTECTIAVLYVRTMPPKTIHSHQSPDVCHARACNWLQQRPSRYIEPLCLCAAAKQRGKQQRYLMYPDVRTPVILIYVDYTV